MPESDHPNFFHRRPLFSAVLAGAIFPFLIPGVGIIAGPVVAGFLYFRNMPLDETKSIWRTGAKAGVLASFVYGVPGWLIIFLYVTDSVDPVTPLLYVTPALIVWMILITGLGGFGAWLKNWHSMRGAG